MRLVSTDAVLLKQIEQEGYDPAIFMLFHRQLHDQGEPWSGAYSAYFKQ